MNSSRCIRLYAKAASFQCGASLTITLLLLAAGMVLTMTTARIAVQTEKAARNARDHQIAFHAAEAALADAEADINSTLPRTSSFFVALGSRSGTGCGQGTTNLYLGLCDRPVPGGVPAWLSVDFLDENAVTMQSVPYGKFTGRIYYPHGGYEPAKVPRYLIELLPDSRPGQQPDNFAGGAVYRITALGFGVRESTQVMLQTVYRKEEH